MIPLNLQHIYRPEHIGQFAYELLQHEQMGIVIGINSKGFFVKTNSEDIFFITFEPFKGPLTINMVQNIAFHKNLYTNIPISVGEGILSIPNIDVQIQTNSDMIWNPSLPPSPLRTSQERIKFAKSITADILEQIDHQIPGINHIIRSLESIALRNSSIMMSLPFPFKHLLSIQNNLYEGHLTETLEIIHTMLGMGEGLTPTGDDLILGILLCLNRWKAEIYPALNLQQLNNEVIRLALNKTTTLSTKLLSCATHGQADERLVYSIDSIMCDLPFPEDVAKKLLSWENSSGIFAFIGMAVSLQLF